MTRKLKATVTFVYEYTADSKYYGDNDNLENMIQIDKSNFENDPLLFMESVVDYRTESKIDIVENFK